MEEKRTYLDPNAISRLAGMEVAARLVVEGFISGMHKSPYQGFSVEFVEHRQYMPGDEIRYIDWKVFGKSDRYYIKKFEEETNLRSYIVLDTSGSMGFKSDKASNMLTKFDYACFLSASLTYLMLKQRDSVGLVTFDDRLKTYIPPRNGPSHLHIIISELEKSSPGKETNISTTFHELAQRIVRRGLVIIISDLLDDPEKVLRSLKHFRHKKHEVIVFHVLDPAELMFPFDGTVLFRDMETQRQLTIEAEILKDEYLRKIKNLINEYKNGCNASLIDYVQIDTSVPFDYALSAYLSKRNRQK
ncbi:TPA: DUF58 domain-containing protein [Candidatus Poribacteria bacterium]|nr:DUF58 domain-containing protein [Candidatus Poribacteria bacterium]